MNPVTREETFLARAAGQDVETPTPVTRNETYLNEIIERLDSIEEQITVIGETLRINGGE